MYHFLPQNFSCASLFYRKRGAFLPLQDFSAKTWRVFPFTTFFHQKRDAFLLLQVCFVENVPRFYCYRFVPTKTWQVLPDTGAKDVIRHILLIFNGKIK